jgi:hypothetical protein
MTANRPLPTAALAEAARALRLALVLHGLVRWAAISGGGLLVLLVLDELLHLPQALRLPMAVVLGGYILIDFYRRVWRPSRRPLSPARAARLLEIDRGIGGNLLINAHQFERDFGDPRVMPFIGAIVNPSRNLLGTIPTRSLWLTAPLQKWFFGLVLIAIGWAVIVFAFPHYVATGMQRIFMPLADIPPAGNWSITVTPNTHVQLVEGDRLDITAHLQSQLGLKTPPPVPQVVWQDIGATVDTSGGEHAAMQQGATPNDYVFSFSTVSQSFRFHVAAEDSLSSSVTVDVSPLPQLKGSTFEITPPAYTGLKTSTQPGPPETLEVPAGSTVTARVQLAPQSPGVMWRIGKDITQLTADGDGWKYTQTVNDSSDYDLLTALVGTREPRVLGRGQITATPDRPPQVDFVTDNRNIAANPGGTLPVTIKATDDYGVASITLRIAPGDDAANVKELKTWKYDGPPGQPAPKPETYEVELSPAIFTPGSTFLLTAQAADFSPAGQKTISRPIVIRVAGVQDMAVPQGDALEKLFGLLRDTIALQTKANGLTDNLRLHLDEAIKANDLTQHFGGMKDTQRDAQIAGMAALAEADAHDEGKVYHGRIDALVNGEMTLALDQVKALAAITQSDTLDAALDPLQKRQVYILNQLIALLGQMASDRAKAAELAAKKPLPATAPLTTTEAMGKLKEELKKFNSEQKRIVDATKAFHGNPEDLTANQQEVLGKLARDEAKQAQFFQEKLTDLSKLALQDFGDGKVVADTNEVYQEVQKASKALYAKRAEIAVPGETAGLEKASELAQNLEKWLPSTPDNTKWNMEEPAGSGQQDVPLAELPKQLDDLIGDLLHKEQEMDPDKDDPSSSIMDSMDKGAGWGASDGPMSNMSAKGVTGNQLPNNNEENGRSGEGRNGKSDGEMVGNTAVGKGGNETPTRMTSTPFENGSVADQSKGTKGGATGGGKLAGFGEDGLRGPMPPAVQQRVRMLAMQQSKLRQQAESLALALKKERKPTGDLDVAVAGMKHLEAAADSKDGLALEQGYHQALDALQSARADYSGEHLSRVEADNLGRSTQPDVNDSQAQQAPAGYEDMTSAYFRSLGGDSSNQSGGAAAPAADSTTAPAPDASVAPTPDASTTPAPTATATPAPASTSAPASATAPAASSTPAPATPPPAPTP